MGEGEIERLRVALIETGRELGCLLADDVSTDFLTYVPGEARAKMEALRDGTAVHLNMLRGGIARPTPVQIVHLYGAAALRSALGDDLRAGPELIAGEPCTLADCPPGLFRWEGTLCFKSEYHSKPGQPDAYVVVSGEYFWGGTSGNLDARNALIVTPITEGRTDA